MSVHGRTGRRCLLYRGTLLSTGRCPVIIISSAFVEDIADAVIADRDIGRIIPVSDPEPLGNMKKPSGISSRAGSDFN